MFEENIYQMVDQNNGKEIKQVLDTENNKVIWERAIPTYDIPIIPTRNAPLLEVSVDGVCVAVDSSLPDGYVELESVVFDGSSYFDTGIVVTSFDYEIESDAVFPNNSSTPIAVWGFMDSSHGNLPRWMTGVFNSQWLTTINNTLPIGTYDSDRHKIKNTLYLNNNTPNWTTFIDGTEVAASTTVINNTSLIESNTLSIYIGARNNNGTAGNFFNGTFYGIKIVKDNVLIRNYVALKRLSDNVIVLYDKVNGVILQNLGEGTLTAGNLVHQTPTNPFDIYCNNGAVKYGAIGKNLCNPDASDVVNGDYINDAGAQITDHVSLLTGYIPVEAGDTYTAQGYSQASGSNLRVHGYNSAKMWVEMLVKKTMPQNELTAATFTVPSGVAYVRVCGYIGYIGGRGAMLEKGSTASEYEPYREGIYTDGTPEVLSVTASGATTQTASVPNLYAVGNYADEVNIISGGITRKVGVRVFNGTETFIAVPSGAYTYPTYYTDNTITNRKTGESGITTHFVTGTLSDLQTKVGYCFFGASTQRVNFSVSSDLDTAVKFKAYLAAQYAAGTPVIVVYPLVEETTESIIPQTLQGYRGKTIIVTAQSQYVSGQNIKVKYLGIDNSLNLLNSTVSVDTSD